jgi:hypothetical protein
MKLSSILNLVMAGQDVLDLFEDVDNVAQLRGRLRRLDQLEADDLLTCLEGLRPPPSRAPSATPWRPPPTSLTWESPVTTSRTPQTSTASWET